MAKTSLAAPEAALDYMNALSKTPAKDVLSVQYYARFWEKSATRPWFLSWSWPAFFFGALWFYLRRMYLWGTVALALNVWFTIYLFAPFGQALFGDDPSGLAVFESFLVVFGVWLVATLVFGVVCGLFGNTLYLRHVRAALAREPKARGGLNLLLPILLWSIIAISIDTFGKIMNETLEGLTEEDMGWVADDMDRGLPADQMPQM